MPDSPPPAATLAASPAALSPEHICGIVVTYQPDEAALACLQQTLACAPWTVVIDNGSAAPCRERLRALTRHARATLVEHPVNAGVGAALNLGIRTAAALGHQWFLLLDQDTRLFPTTLADLTRAHQQCRAELGDCIALTGSNYFQQCADGSIREALVPYSRGRLWHEADLAITAGSLLGLHTFSALGPFREDYFIDHIDHEYCLRARRHGLLIIQTVHPIMAQRIGLRQHRRVWLKLGARSALSGYSPLRRYYQCRNLLILARDYEQDFPRVIRHLRRHFLREAKRALLYEGRFLPTLRALLHAVRDARQGHLGPYQPAPRRDFPRQPPLPASSPPAAA